jgi:hypothetical protein
MAQKQIELSKLETQIKVNLIKNIVQNRIRNRRHTSTQTGEFKLFINLSKTKTLHMYYSKSYKDIIICLKFSNNKKYILTRDCWNRLKQNILIIEDGFKL